MEWEVAEKITGTSNAVASIMSSRHIVDTEEFLYGEISNLYTDKYDPMKMKGMSEGISRIAKAIKKKQLIMVEGDYDADGVTSTATFVMGLRELGAEVIYHIPMRKDGYGLSKKAVDIAMEEGADLIVTCDNGIAAFEAVDYANSLHLDVVITDHHKVQDKIPNAFAVINPQQVDCPYPTKELSGCGVVFKVLQALNLMFNGDSKRVEKYLDIVCIGTVGDVMKLVGENRLITKFGLQMLAKTNNRGLSMLLRALSLNDKDEITVRHLGYNIVPCLNAAGRLGDAGKAVEMLITESKRNAFRTANKLKEINEERRKLSEEWTKKIVHYIKEDENLMNANILLVPYTEEIPEGLVGIIAGKVKEAFRKPTILLSLVDTDNGPVYKGSGRSIPAYNMFKEILPYKSLTVGFGGHEMACGLSIKEENIPELQNALNDNCTLTEDDLNPVLHIDYEIEPELITKSFVEELALMEPFGNGNEQPLFLLRDVMMNYPKKIGKNENHLKFQGQCDEEYIDMIGWSMVKKWEELGKPTTVDVTFHPGLNTWNNKTKVQLELKDIRESTE